MNVNLKNIRVCAGLVAVWAVLAGASALAAPAPSPAKSSPAAPSPAKASAAPAAPVSAPAKAAIWGKLTAADGGKVYELSGPEVIIGTDKDCQVPLADKTVSARHAKITYAEGVVEVHDLGARGGTLVAGTAVKVGKPFRVLQPVEMTFAAATLNFVFGERPSLLPPTQKGKPPGKAAGRKIKGK